MFTHIERQEKIDLIHKEEEEVDRGRTNNEQTINCKNTLKYNKRKSVEKKAAHQQDGTSNLDFTTPILWV